MALHLRDICNGCSEVIARKLFAVIGINDTIELNNPVTSEPSGAIGVPNIVAACAAENITVGAETWRPRHIAQSGIPVILVGYGECKAQR